MVEVNAEMDENDKENKTKRKKKKVPVGGFQEEVCDKGCMVKVKVEMDENKTKKKKIAQGNDSVNGTSKKRKIDQEQSQPFPRVDQYLNERAIKNAQRKRKIAEEGDKGNNKKRNMRQMLRRMYLSKDFKRKSMTKDLRMEMWVLVQSLTQKVTSRIRMVTKCRRSVEKKENRL